MIFATNPLGHTTDYTYDSLGRLEQIILPDPDPLDGDDTRPRTVYHYDTAGQLTSVDEIITATQTRATNYAYDDIGRMTQILRPDPDPNDGDPTHPQTDFNYDAAGQLISVDELVIAGQTRTTSYAYDQLGRLIRVVQPDLATGMGTAIGEMPGPDIPFTTYTYNIIGDLLSVTDALGYATTYNYDGLGRLITRTDENGDSVGFSYDLIGNLLTLTDPPSNASPQGNTTTWTYDDLNRAKTETNELGDTRLYEYDLAGNLVQRTDRIGRVSTYGYDSLDRSTGEFWYTDQNHLDTDPLNPLRAMVFTYDLVGQPLESIDPDHTYTWEYDDARRVDYHTQDITGLVPTIEFTSEYDLLGRRIEMQADMGTAPTDPNDFINSYIYNSNNSMTRVIQDGVGGQASAVADKRVDFSYDLVGQFDEINRYASLDTSDPIADTDFMFDFAGRLDQIEHTDASLSGSGVLIAGYDFEWDSSNRLTAIDFLPNGVNSPFNYSDEDVIYGYDPRDQLTVADRDGTSNDEEYICDENGNRLSATSSGTPPTGNYDVGPNNQILSDGTYIYTYDEEGNRSTRTNISTGESTEYTWDHRNRLICIEEKNASGTVIQRVDQSYDGFNQWIRRVVDPDGDTGGADLEQTVFVHENGQIVLQFDDTGGSNLTEDDLSHRYLWGPVVDQLLADEQVDGYTEAGETLWALTDQLGSVRDMVSYDDATSDTILRKHTSYDAFGNVTAEQYYDADGNTVNSTHAQAVDTIFGYTGRPLDDATDLQNNLHRWYDSKVGRWISEDPIGFVAGDANLGRYVENQPSVLIDQSGLIPNRQDVKALEWLIQRVRETELALPDKNASEILRIVQNEMCWGFMGKQNIAKSLDLVDSARPSRQLKWSYIYTEEAEWVDIGHFLTSARAALDNQSAVVYWGGILWEVYSQYAGEQDPGEPGMGSSAFTLEDVPSNTLGIWFGSHLQEGKNLSCQLEDFFKTLRATNPKDAWNYCFLPRDEHEWERCWQNYPGKDNRAMRGARIVLDPNHPYWKKHPPNSGTIRQYLNRSGVFWAPMLKPPQTSHQSLRPVP